MSGQPDRRLVGVIRRIVTVGTGLQVFVAFLIVVPFTLWLAWARRDDFALSAMELLFCPLFVWLNISVLRCQRYAKKMGWRGPSRIGLGLGPRPKDEDELELWKRGRQLVVSFSSLALFMASWMIGLKLWHK